MLELIFAPLKIFLTLIYSNKIVDIDTQCVEHIYKEKEKRRKESESESKNIRIPTKTNIHTYVNAIRNVMRI